MNTLADHRCNAVHPIYNRALCTLPRDHPGNHRSVIGYQYKQPSTTHEWERSFDQSPELVDDPELCSLCGEVKHYHDCEECDGKGHIGRQRCNFCDGFGWFRDCINRGCKAYNKVADLDFAKKLEASHVKNNQ